MPQEFFTNLPSEIIINILSRLPLGSIIHCKCVCKSWLDLLETPEFIKSHHSESAPILVVFQEHLHSKAYRVFEFVDVLGHEHHDLHYNPIISFDFPHHASIEASTNGLLFLHDSNSDALYVCNPITRDYIQLPCPKWNPSSYPQVYTFGFGSSRMSGQYKVVKIFHNCIRNQETRRLRKVPEAECQVYTLGTGSWRSLGPGVPLIYHCSNNGAFINGNLHWLVRDVNNTPLISCFDLETETFSTFSPPHLGQQDHDTFVADVFALDDCLCLCDNSSNVDIVIWLIKEYEVEKSWMKQFVISKIPYFVGESYEVVCPIKVFKDGDILMRWEGWLVAYYSNKTKTIQKVDMFENSHYINAITTTPSFLTLKSFPMENVSSF